MKAKHLVLAILIAATPAFSASYLVSFEKGLNLDSPPDLVPDGHLTGWSYNFVSKPDGRIEKRPGFARNSTLTSLAPVPYEGGPAIFDNDRLMVMSGDQAQWINQSLGTAIRDSAKLTGFMDKARAIYFDDAIYYAVQRDTTATVAGYVADVWRFDLTTNAWGRWRADSLKVKDWGRYVASATRRSYLYYTGYGGAASNNVFLFDPDRTSDSTNGAQVDIVSRAISKKFTAPTSNTLWTHYYVTIDAQNEDVVISAIVEAPWGNTTATILSLSGAGNTRGQPVQYRIPINLMGRSCQIQIVSTGKGRCVVYPGVLYGDPRPQ